MVEYPNSYDAGLGGKKVHHEYVWLPTDVVDMTFK